MTEGPKAKKGDGSPPGTPPDLIPPDAMRREEKKSSATPLVVLGGGLLLVIAALLVLFLPMLQNKPTTAAPVESQDTRPAAPQSQPHTKTDSDQITLEEELARDVERLTGVWLQKQAEAEAVNISAWGGQTYARAGSLAKECNRLLEEKEYLPARESCEEALRELEELLASKEVRLEEAIAAGLRAMEEGDQEVAINHFRQALAIVADEERALTGIRRAEQLPSVLKFMQEGLAMESSGDLDGASLAFSEAATLDPDFTPASEASARVQAEIAAREFQLAMSGALQAITAGRLSAARSALQKAESIKPGDRAVRDLKQQLAQTQLAGRLASLRKEAARMEQEERWPEALKHCEEALSLDPYAAFANSCKERVSIRLAQDRRLKDILAKPERLFEDGPRRGAHQTLVRARETTPRGPLLSAQIDSLDRLLTQAEAKVEVVIISDGLTDVTIYHVGRLGPFMEKRLTLRTGNYVATGSRNGFRDVRQVLRVRPESGKMTFTLRCEEPI